MSLRVLLDASAMPAQRVGVGWYVTGLIDAFARRDDVELHVIAKRRDAEDLSARGATVHEMPATSRPTRLLWEQAALPRRARRVDPDLFHGPHYTLPRGVGAPAVVTFHDPTFFTHPELHERTKVAFFTRMAKMGAKRAGRVLAVSEYGRRGAIEHAGAAPDRTDVVPLGVDAARYTPDGDEGTDARLRARVGVEGPYLLWVGALEPRKDVPSLVEAFARLVERGTDATLVLAGPPAWGAAAIEASIERCGVADRILRTGYVSEEEKIALYRGAAAFAYPSLAEGFGIPVVEAMACGCPVVTTTGSAPEEIAGGAAVLVPPKEPDALAEAVGTLLDDPAHAAEVRRRGLERAAEHTWERTAAGTLAAYRRAVDA